LLESFGQRNHFIVLPKKSLFCKHGNLQASSAHSKKLQTEGSSVAELDNQLLEARERE